MMNAQTSETFRSYERISHPELYSGKIFWNGLLLFLGAASAFYVQLVGQLYISEPILLGAFIFLFLKKRRYLLKYSFIRNILFGGLAWFLSQVIADLYLSTPITDALRGWALIFFFLADFLGLCALIFPSFRRLAIFALGFGIGLVLQVLLQPNPFFSHQFWKFGYGYPITLLIILCPVFLFKHLGWLRVWSILVFLIGIFSLYMDFRSLGGMTMLTAVLVWVRLTRFGSYLAARLNPLTIAASGIFLFAGAYVILLGYNYLGERGVLSEYAAQRQKWTSGDSIENIIMGSRSNVLPAIYAIIDSPWIGHGSWARDPAYRSYYFDALYLTGAPIDESDWSRVEKFVTTRDLISPHSHILQAWVWSGIIGAVFWVVLLAAMLKALIAALQYPNMFLPLSIFLGLMGLWNVFFSPLGSGLRLQWALTLNMFLYCLYFAWQAKAANPTGQAGS